MNNPPNAGPYTQVILVRSVCLTYTHKTKNAQGVHQDHIWLRAVSHVSRLLHPVFLPSKFDESFLNMSRMDGLVLHKNLPHLLLKH